MHDQQDTRRCLPADGTGFSLAINEPKNLYDKTEAVPPSFCFAETDLIAVLQGHKLTENLSSSRAMSCMASIESRPSAPNGASCFVFQSEKQ